MPYLHGAAVVPRIIAGSQKKEKKKEKLTL